MSGPHPGPAGPATQAEPDTAALVCEADVVQLDLPEDADPFGAVLEVAGVHSSGAELAVWLRLTPTTIDRLVTQLRQLLHEQQTALGIPQGSPAGDDLSDSDSDSDSDVESADGPAEPGEGRVRRLLDPLGIRHLKGRSPRSTVIMAAAIAALMLLAFIVQLVRG